MFSHRLPRVFFLFAVLSVASTQASLFLKSVDAAATAGASNDVDNFDCPLPGNWRVFTTSSWRQRSNPDLSVALHEISTNGPLTTGSSFYDLLIEAEYGPEARMDRGELMKAIEKEASLLLFNTDKDTSLFIFNTDKFAALNADFDCVSDPKAVVLEYLAPANLPQQGSSILNYSYLPVTNKSQYPVLVKELTRLLTKGVLGYKDEALERVYDAVNNSAIKVPYIKYPVPVRDYSPLVSDILYAVRLQRFSNHNTISIEFWVHKNTFKDFKTIETIETMLQVLAEPTTYGSLVATLNYALDDNVLNSPNTANAYGNSEYVASFSSQAAAVAVDADEEGPKGTKKKKKKNKKNKNKKKATASNNEEKDSDSEDEEVEAKAEAETEVETEAAMFAHKEETVAAVLINEDKESSDPLVCDSNVIETSADVNVADNVIEAGSGVAELGDVDTGLAANDTEAVTNTSPQTVTEIVPRESVEPVIATPVQEQGKSKNKKKVKKHNASVTETPLPVVSAPEKAKPEEDLSITVVVPEKSHEKAETPNKTDEYTTPYFEEDLKDAGEWKNVQSEKKKTAKASTSIPNAKGTNSGKVAAAAQVSSRTPTAKSAPVPRHKYAARPVVSAPAETKPPGLIKAIPALIPAKEAAVQFKEGPAQSTHVAPSTNKSSNAIMAVLKGPSQHDALRIDTEPPVRQASPVADSLHEDSPICQSASVSQAPLQQFSPDLQVPPGFKAFSATSPKPLPPFSRAVTPIHVQNAEKDLEAKLFDADSTPFDFASIFGPIKQDPSCPPGLHKAQEQGFESRPFLDLSTFSEDSSNSEYDFSGIPGFNTNMFDTSEKDEDTIFDGLLGKQSAPFDISSCLGLFGNSSAAPFQPPLAEPTLSESKLAKFFWNIDSENDNDNGNSGDLGEIRRSPDSAVKERSDSISVMENSAAPFSQEELRCSPDNGTNVKAPAFVPGVGVTGSNPPRPVVQTAPSHPHHQPRGSYRAPSNPPVQAGPNYAPQYYHPYDRNIVHTRQLHHQPSSGQFAPHPVVHSIPIGPPLLLVQSIPIGPPNHQPQLHQAYLYPHPPNPGYPSGQFAPYNYYQHSNFYIPQPPGIAPTIPYQQAGPQMHPNTNRPPQKSSGRTYHQK